MASDAGSPTLTWRPIESRWSIRRTLAPHRYGRADPTTRFGEREMVRAARTPDGPGTLWIRWSADPAPAAEVAVTADAWGPGAQWLLDGVDRLIGRDDRAVEFDDAAPAVRRALDARRSVRVTASGDPYHLLLPTVIGQRITGHESLRQWARLANELGQPAPGPADLAGDLRLPPEPHVVARTPLWWFHPIGIEAARARTLVEAGRHADKMWAWAEDGPTRLAERLRLLRGVGAWTADEVVGPTCGDPDSVPVGDYHYPNQVAWALAEEPRGDDERMLELLAPYAPHRGRVLRAIVSTTTAPKFGPRQRVLPMHRW